MLVICVLWVLLINSFFSSLSAVARECSRPPPATIGCQGGVFRCPEFSVYDFYLSHSDACRVLRRGRLRLALREFFEVYSSRPAVFLSNRYNPLCSTVCAVHGRSGVQGSDRLALQARRLHRGLVRTTAASTAYKGCRRRHRHRHHHHHHHPHSSLHSSLAGSQNSKGLTDQALLIHCSANCTICSKYYCFLI